MSPKKFGRAEPPVIQNPKGTSTIGVGLIGLITSIAGLLAADSNPVVAAIGTITSGIMVIVGEYLRRK